MPCISKILIAVLAVPAAHALGACSGAPARVDDPAQSAPTALAPAASTRCLRETGTRLPPGLGTCHWGRVIEREEIESSGALNVSEALNRVGGL